MEIEECFKVEIGQSILWNYDLRQPCQSLDKNLLNCDLRQSYLRLNKK